MTLIFKHSSKDIFLVAQTLLVLAIAYAMAIADLSLFWNLLIAPFHIYLIVNAQNSTLHHHAHWTTFGKKSWNHVYDLLVSAACGNKVQTYRMVHNTHHKYVNDVPVDGKCKDPISVFGHGSDGELDNVWKFSFRLAKMQTFDHWKYVLLTSWKSVQPKMPLYNFTLWRREQFAIVAFMLSVMLINLPYGLWLAFVIYFVAHFFGYAWHFGDHYGSYHLRGDTTQDSVGIYSKWYNVLTFNAGYHQEHHHKTNVHWSKLPEITPLLPDTRITTRGMHLTNVPWLSHLKLLLNFKPR